MKVTPASSVASRIARHSSSEMAIGFIEQHVLAGAGGGDRQRRVLVVDRADVHGVDIRLFEHLVGAGEDRIDAGLVGEFERRVLADIAGRREPDIVRRQLVAGQVLPRNPACADQSDLQWLSHGPRPFAQRRPGCSLGARGYRLRRGIGSRRRRLALGP